MGDGVQTRDFVNVKDIVQANILAMKSDNAVGEVFNVASGESTTILELFELLRTCTGRYDIDCQFAPARPGDVKNGRADIEKIRNTLGFRSQVSLKRALKIFYDRVQSPRDSRAANHWKRRFTHVRDKSGAR